MEPNVSAKNPDIETENKVSISEEEALVQREYSLLIQDYLNSNHRRKVEKIDKAFHLAKDAHAGAKRRSGEPYILHPIAVARIVCQEIGLGSTSICCALLHDVVEDTEYTVDDMRDMFGEKVAQIVDGLTKISGEVFSNSSAQAENFRKLILTMNDDIRVILIKIADRLHNMRTLDSMLPAKQMKIAGETQYVYAPLAHRLGLFAIKSELEDLSFKYEHPQEYEAIKEKIRITEQHRLELFEHFATPLKQRFAGMGMSYEMKARVKSVYSIWKKMEKKGVPFEEIYDLFAVRIIFESSPNVPDKNRCWEIYSAITDIYRNRPDRIRDWVSNPKSNGYQALHLTVMGPDGEWVEVQIRSRRMDDIAEKGFAAHWKYKGDNVEEDSELEKWLSTIQEILENPNPNALDFLDTIKLNLFSNEVMVFTPKGEIKRLPQGATALDFAYSLHSDLGDHCIGAKVNHKLVPLSYVLNSGDQVEVLSSKSQQPTEEWLRYVTTARAKSKVDSFLRRKRREMVNRGEEKVVSVIRTSESMVSAELLDRIAAYFGFLNRETFFYAVGTGTVSLPESFKKLLQGEHSGNFLMRAIRSALKAGKSNKTSSPSGKPAEKEDKKAFNTKKTYILQEDEFSRNYQIAECCKPIPGDDAFGFINDDDTVVVHKRSCPIAMRLKSSFGNRILSTEWSLHSHTSFEAKLALKGIDSTGILTAVTQIISEDFNVGIKHIQLTAKDGIFEGQIHLLVHNSDDLLKICHRLRQNKYVQSVGRVS
ncbi:GTP pyrophosphokinase [Porphyromonas gulae]|uniref:RelA/SpoT family protein n=1 Tax=Porphyromonas gulae TaxID=111105 RepID=UPI00038291B9|nr:RelA/SpoT family protein [Porphyromonas gulae]KGN67994.1 GTP pyrophosphokinase [Porphyromonas gulae]KGN75552.1 GTP pyrophosphokinase [Porphyromonas gulae]KGN81662.1 GTP pyrophosphokinase [Porphyromonas gulae]